MNSRDFFLPLRPLLPLRATLEWMILFLLTSRNRARISRKTLTNFSFSPPPPPCPPPPVSRYIHGASPATTPPTLTQNGSARVEWGRQTPCPPTQLFFSSPLCNNVCKRKILPVADFPAFHDLERGQIVDLNTKPNSNFFFGGGGGAKWELGGFVFRTFSLPLNFGFSSPPSLLHINQRLPQAASFFPLQKDCLGEGFSYIWRKRRRSRRRRRGRGRRKRRKLFSKSERECCFCNHHVLSPDIFFLSKSEISIHSTRIPAAAAAAVATAAILVVVTGVRFG